MCLHDREVVGDEEVGQPLSSLLQVLQQVDDLGLDGDVEGRDGLVADDERGVAGQGAGDADALALAAGELVGEAVGHRGVEADDAEELLDASSLCASPVHDQVVDAQGLADDAAGALAGVERGVGVLEDEAHVAADGPQICFSGRVVMSLPSKMILPAVGL